MRNLRVRPARIWLSSGSPSRQTNREFRSLQLNVTVTGRYVTRRAGHTTTLGVKSWALKFGEMSGIVAAHPDLIRRFQSRALPSLTSILVLERIQHSPNLRSSSPTLYFRTRAICLNGDETDAVAVQCPPRVRDRRVELHGRVDGGAAGRQRSWLSVAISLESRI